MTNRTSTRADTTLGWLGLLLMLVVTRLADQSSQSQPTVGGRLSRFLSCRAIDGIGGVGWAIDHMFPAPAGDRPERPSPSPAVPC
jgi:hypothetical protein